MEGDGMTAKAEINKLRRTYFACCKSLGIGDETRHELNAEWTVSEQWPRGKESTRKWTISEWRNVVAELQRQCGMEVTPGRPRVRMAGTDAQSPEMATGAQCAAIDELVASVHWRNSAESFVRQRLLVPLRGANWDGRWESLFKGEATKVILVLRKMARRVA